jgi:hypothetical protein
LVDTNAGATSFDISSTQTVKADQLPIASYSVVEREVSIAECKEDDHKHLGALVKIEKIEVNSEGYDTETVVMENTLDKLASTSLDSNLPNTFTPMDVENTDIGNMSGPANDNSNDVDNLDIKDDTEDLDDIQDSDYWDTRQSFLNLCQGNHYQFDQLRRAKYSSLLVLYHMHNPDAPKFLPNCHNCFKDINSGVRRHCETCDWDFCQTCYQNNGGARIHPHNLRAVPITGNAPVQQITAQERIERQNTVRMHVELLVHSSYCEDSNCCKEKRNCTRMKVIKVEWFCSIFF